MCARLSFSISIVKRQLDVGGMVSLCSITQPRKMFQISR